MSDKRREILKYFKILYDRGYSDGINHKAPSDLETFTEVFDQALAELDALELSEAEIINVVQTEEELDGPMPEEVRTLMAGISIEENMRAVVRSTKNSIERRIREAALKKKRGEHE